MSIGPTPPSDKRPNMHRTSESDKAHKASEASKEINFKNEPKNDNPLDQAKERAQKQADAKNGGFNAFVKDTPTKEQMVNARLEKTLAELEDVYESDITESEKAAQAEKILDQYDAYLNKIPGTAGFKGEAIQRTSNFEDNNLQVAADYIDDIAEVALGNTDKNSIMNGAIKTEYEDALKKLKKLENSDLSSAQKAAKAEDIANKFNKYVGKNSGPTGKDDPLTFNVEDRFSGSSDEVKIGARVLEDSFEVQSGSMKNPLTKRFAEMTYDAAQDKLAKIDGSDKTPMEKSAAVDKVIKDFNKKMDGLS